MSYPHGEFDDFIVNGDTEMALPDTYKAAWVIGEFKCVLCVHNHKSTKGCVKVAPCSP